MKHLKSYLTAGVFLLVLFGFAAAHLLLPDRDISEAERRKLAKPPQLTTAAVLSGKYRQFDTSGFPNLKYIIPVSEGQELDYAIAHEPENLRRGTEKLFSIIEKEGY